MTDIDKQTTEGMTPGQKEAKKLLENEQTAHDEVAVRYNLIQEEARDLADNMQIAEAQYKRRLGMWADAVVAGRPEKELLLLRGAIHAKRADLFSTASAEAEFTSKMISAGCDPDRTGDEKAALEAAKKRAEDEEGGE